MTKSEKAVLSAAVEWWRGYRPLGWDTEEHLHQPGVNATGSRAQRLLEAIGRMVGERRKR